MLKRILAFVFPVVAFIAIVQSESYRLIRNPDTGRLDWVTVVSSTTLPGGSTYYIQNTNALQQGATFYVSSGTVLGQISVNSIKFPDGTVQVTSAPFSSGGGGGGGSPLEVFSNFDETRSSPTLSISIGDSMFLGVTGSTAILNVDISSVTFGLITASSVSANYITLSSVSANFLTKSSASVTYLPITSSTTFLTTSSAVATYFPLVSSTTLLTISSATANFLSLSSASANYLTRSSATATYFQIASTPTFMSQSSATANFLTQSSATATYFQIASTPTFMSQSSATANFLTLSSAAVTYINQLSSGAFIQNRNTLQSGSTFYVSSGTASTFNTTTANVGTLNATTINGSPWGAANLVAYLNGANVLTTNPSFIYFDAFSILYAPSILGTSYMGGAFGAPIVSFDADNSNFVGFISSSVVTTDNLYTIPPSSGAVNQVWVLDGSNKFQNKYVNQIMKFSQVFNPEQAKVPGDAPCIVTNSVDATVPGILCDASSDEYVTWSTVLTPYTTTTMVADVYYTMVSTNSGSVVHNISVMCASSTYTPALDTASFGPVNASTVTVPGAIGRMGVARVTLSSMDTGCNSGSIFIVKYNRDANASADTAPGDIYVRKVWLYEP